MKYTTLISLFAILSACGGGGSSTGDNIATVESFPEESLVYGETKQINEITYAVSACDSTIQETAFQSENFSVFAEPGVSEKSLKMAATFAEEGLELISEKFNVTVEEMLSYRPIYNSKAFDFLNTTWMSQYSAPTERSIDYLEPGALPADFDDLDYYDQVKLVHDYWYNMNKAEQNAALERAAMLRNLDSETFRTDRGIIETPDRLIICLINSSESIGEAETYGLRMQPPEDAAEWNRENDFELYKRIVDHELVHVVSYFVPTEKETLLMPIWFMEGIAEYITNGPIAGNVDRNFILDRNEILFSEYDEAARVVKYLADDLGNGNKSIYELMLTMRAYATGEEQYFHPSYLDDISFNSFPQAFREAFTDFDGSELTLEELHDEFIQRLN
ncbi:hypothetical protein [Alkalimarinus alittae]|uniref:DUF1570 domain-containing protein n=1 Tax=Alkalimarinus alittae TaxID=2961619 RepID=A0ABY6MX45_9ALTE|nr:hypothetical protein [Alkalimarinus alittae]UZE94401.1 hypothetical protein NKI27_09865 [Alkalimarinus alittae]